MTPSSLTAKAPRTDLSSAPSSSSSTLPQVKLRQSELGSSSRASSSSSTATTASSRARARLSTSVNNSSISTAGTTGARRTTLSSTPASAPRRTLDPVRAGRPSIGPSAAACAEASAQNTLSTARTRLLSNPSTPKASARARLSSLSSLAGPSAAKQSSANLAAAKASNPSTVGTALSSGAQHRTRTLSTASGVSDVSATPNRSGAGSSKAAGAATATPRGKAAASTTTAPISARERALAYAAQRQHQFSGSGPARRSNKSRPSLDGLAASRAHAAGTSAAEFSRTQPSPLSELSEDRGNSNKTQRTELGQQQLGLAASRGLAPASGAQQQEVTMDSRGSTASSSSRSRGLSASSSSSAPFSVRSDHSGPPRRNDFVAPPLHSSSSLGSSRVSSSGRTGESFRTAAQLIGASDLGLARRLAGSSSGRGASHSFLDVSSAPPEQPKGVLDMDAFDPGLMDIVAPGTINYGTVEASSSARGNARAPTWEQTLDSPSRKSLSSYSTASSLRRQAGSINADIAAGSPRSAPPSAFAASAGKRSSSGSSAHEPRSRGASIDAAARTDPGHSPELSSKFSEFSSAAGTPEIAQTSMSFSSSRPSIGSSSLSRQWSDEGAALQPEGALAYASPSGHNLSPLAARSDAPVTPRRQVAEGRATMPSQIITPTHASMAGLQTPVASPRILDRSGQVGIGELATPRLVLPPSNQLPWANTVRSRDAPSPLLSTDLPPHLSSYEQPYSAPIGAESLERQQQRRQMSGGDSGGFSMLPASARLPSNMPSSGNTHGGSRGTEGSRHGRSTSYSVGGPGSREVPMVDDFRATGMTSSASVAPGSSLAGYAALSSLARGFESNPAEFLAEFESFTARKRERDSFARPQKQGREPSPTFSIDAHSDDGTADSLPSDLSGSKAAAVAAVAALLRSPSNAIGDTAWSADEMGPFGADSSMQSPRAQARDIAEASLHGEARPGPATEGTSVLDGAMSGLRIDESASGRPAGESSGSASRSAHSASLRAPVVSVSSPTSPRSAVKSVSDARRRDSSAASSPATHSRRSSAKMTNSPGARHLALDGKRQANGTGVEADGHRAAKASAETDAPSTRKRASSVSIAQSLLRGSMPLQAAEEYQSILSGAGRKSRGSGELDDAAKEALRKLDGIRPTTPKSPRNSRPISAGKASGSRSASPVKEKRDSLRPETQRHKAQPSPQSRKLSVGAGMERYALPPTLPSGPLGGKRMSLGAGPPSSAAKAQRTMRQQEANGLGLHTSASSYSHLSDVHRSLVPPVPPLPAVLDVRPRISASSSSSSSTSFAAATALPASATFNEDMEHMNTESDQKAAKETRRGSSSSLARKFSLSSLTNVLNRSPSTREVSRPSSVIDPQGAPRRGSALLVSTTASPPTGSESAPLAAPTPPSGDASSLQASPSHRTTSSDFSASSAAAPRPSPREVSGSVASASSQDRADKDDRSSLQSGRASRTRSILGIGGLLRSASRRNSQTNDSEANVSSENKGLMSRINLGRNSMTPSAQPRKRTTVSHCAAFAPALAVRLTWPTDLTVLSRAAEGPRDADAADAGRTTRSSRGKGGAEELPFSRHGHQLHDGAAVCVTYATSKRQRRARQSYPSRDRGYALWTVQRFNARVFVAIGIAR